MKLSKQERIGVLIIAVVLIIGLGIFFFVVPKFKEVSASSAQLENKQAEYQAAVDKANLKDGLRDQVIGAYEQGRDLADMFFEEMTPYELDAEVRAFLDSAKAAGHNIVVEDLNVSKPATSTLSVSFFKESELSYELKSYATQGQQPTEEELAAQARRDKLMSILSEAQTVGASTANFTVTAMTPEELVAFIDYINEYIKTEEGKQIRKALMFEGTLSVTYDEVTDKYAEIAEEMEAEIEDAAYEELKKNVGDKADIPDKKDKNNGQTGAAEGENADADEEKEDKIPLTDCIYSKSISLTFYFIERMQDPTDILNQQEAA